VRVTAGRAESNGSVPPGLTRVTCTLTAENRDEHRNPMLGSRVWATYTFYLLILWLANKTFKMLLPVEGNSVRIVEFMLADICWFNRIYLIRV